MLVDGLDFSDDKMLVGRTFSYSDTQRYRVGPNYLQLPVNAPKNARGRTNQRDGADDLLRRRDAARTRTSTTSRRSPAGCARRRSPAHDEQGPEIDGPADARARSPRTNDYAQAGERYLHDPRSGSATTWSRT